jgi:hypothetical protein
MKMRQHQRDVVVFLLMAVVFSLAGCIEEVQEPAREFNVVGPVVAVVSPDTVQAGQPFRVQVSFLNVCNGTFSYLSQSTSDSSEVVSPIIHIIPNNTCIGGGTAQTETTTVTFPHVGSYQLFANGSNVQLKKTIHVVSSVAAGQDFTLHYFFVDHQGLPKANFFAFFYFADHTPVDSIQIESDTSGFWDRSFNNTAPRMRYIIDDLSFQATRGIREAGVILYQ